MKYLYSGALLLILISTFATVHPGAAYDIPPYPTQTISTGGWIPGPTETANISWIYTIPTQTSSWPWITVTPTLTPVRTYPLHITVWSPNYTVKVPNVEMYYQEVHYPNCTPGTSCPLILYIQNKYLGTTDIDGDLYARVPDVIGVLEAYSQIYHRGSERWYLSGSRNWNITGTNEIEIELIHKDTPRYPGPYPFRRVYNESSDGSTITIPLNSDFVVWLDENPTTGFGWEMNVTTGLDIVNNRYIPSSSGVDGAGGTHVWEIQAIETGAQKVSGIYRQSWMPVTGNEDTFDLTCNVV